MGNDFSLIHFHSNMFLFLLSFCLLEDDMIPSYFRFRTNYIVLLLQKRNDKQNKMHSFHLVSTHIDLVPLFRCFFQNSKLILWYLHDLTSDVLLLRMKFVHKWMSYQTENKNEIIIIICTVIRHSIPKCINPCVRFSKLVILFKQQELIQTLRTIYESVPQGHRSEKSNNLKSKCNFPWIVWIIAVLVLNSNKAPLNIDHPQFDKSIIYVRIGNFQIIVK